MVNLARIQSAFTSKRWVGIYYSPADCPPRVLDCLRSELPHIDEQSWAERLAWGGVFVNGREVTADETLMPPCRVEYYEPIFPIAAAHEHFPSFEEDWILHTDADALVVYKPAGLPCVPGKEQKIFNLKTYLERHFAQTLHFPSRLDVSTAGLIVCSRSERMNRCLQRLFEQRTIHKLYRAHVSGEVEWESRSVEVQLGRDSRHPVLRRVLTEGGKRSHTEFRRLKTLPFTTAEGEQCLTSLLEAHLHTGRTHQIRVHAQHLGMPVIGDNFYGGFPAESLHLLSYAVEFQHPFLNKQLCVCVPKRFLPAWV